MRVVLVIGGADSCCGAGIQADIKTLLRCGVYGVTSVTAVTAQGSSRVDEIFPIPARIVAGQINSVLREVKPHAVKTGMLWNEHTVMAVSRCIKHHRLRNVVVDPVLSSHGGKRLLNESGRQAIKRYLLPLADLITPNIIEAGILADIRIEGEKDMLIAAKRLLALGPRAVLIKGGHMAGAPVDLYFAGKKMSRFASRRRSAVKLHGSGCILASAIAAWMSRGLSTKQAVLLGRKYLKQQRNSGWKWRGEGAVALHH